MIAPHCFHPDWIETKRGELASRDAQLVEKTIHAFALLCRLQEQGMPFVFKGGTSLLLRLPRFRRLSIDIDILCPLSNPELDQALERVASQSPFVRVEEDIREAGRMPARRHFKFGYQTPKPRGAPSEILLDVVQEEAPHPVVEPVLVYSPLFEMTVDVLVQVPTVECLLGDKLTAFAPNTVGIPAIPTKVMDVMKQLFDVAELFDAAMDLEMVGRAYDAICAAECRHREGHFTRQDALLDTLETARQLCRVGGRGVPADSCELLLQGRANLTNHLVGCTFSLNQMKLAAAKAACLAACLLQGGINPLERAHRYDPQMAESLRQVTLRDPVLTKLKGANTESFYYWSLVERMQG